MRRIYFICLAALSLSGCAVSTAGSGLSESLGERASAHGYVPLDPLPVDEIQSDSCRERGSTPSGDVLKDLPDLTIRFAVAEFGAGGSLSFGPSKATTKNRGYRAVLDYINADNVPVDFYIRRRIESPESPPENMAIDQIWFPKGTYLAEELPQGAKITAYEAQISPYFIASEARRLSLTNRSINPEFVRFLDNDDEARFEAESLERQGFTKVTIPIYVGVGLRLSADILALKGDIALSGLGVIGAQAEANNLSGTLTVQTLGINGKAIATSLPLPNKLDQTTIENAILAIGTNRALMFTEADQQSNINVNTRVVGLYSPIGTDPLLINAIYSELSRVRPKWPRPCRN